MAKKKSKSSRLPFAIIGIASVFVVIFLFTGFPLNMIGVNAEQGFLNEINDLPPELEIPTDCIIPSDCVVGEFDDLPTPIEEIILDCSTTTPIPDTDLLLGECNNEVNDPISNMTIFVDPVTGTTVDLEPEPELFDVTISSKVFKTDNFGQRTESKTNFDIPLLAFFVEDTSDIDFDQGIIEQELIVNAPPNTSLRLSADFDILIGNQTILLEPLTIGGFGTTDENGELTVNYINQLGLRSNVFTFLFADHIDKFPITGTEKVDYVLSNVRVTSGLFEFELESVVIYSIVIARDPNQLIIVDELGERTRVFPTDDTLRIYSTTGKRWVERTCSYRRSCSGGYYYCCYVAPAMGGGQFTHILPDGTEEVLATWDPNAVGFCRIFAFSGVFCDTFQKVNIKFQRDEIYRFDIGSPTKASITFKTPMEQANYIFYCKGSSNPAGYCNFLQPSFQQNLRDTLP